MPRDTSFQNPNPALPADVRSEPTLREFLAFCRSKPAGEAYNFHDNHNCAVSQFLRDKGLAKMPTCSGLGWWDRSLPFKRHQPFADDTLLVAHPRTFGALATRLEALSARAGEEVAR